MSSYVDVFPNGSVLTVSTSSSTLSLPITATRIRAVDDATLASVAVLEKEPETNIHVTKDDREWSGQLVSFQNDNVTIRDRYITTVHSPDSVTSKKEIQKCVHVGSDNAHVVCDLHGVSWSPEYILYIDRTSTISLNAQIRSNTSWNVTGLTFHLAPTASESVVRSMASEYHAPIELNRKYRVDMPTNLKNGSIPLASFSNVPTKRIVSVRLVAPIRPTRQLLFDINTQVPRGQAVVYRNGELLSQSVLDTRQGLDGFVAVVDVGPDIRLNVNVANRNGHITVTFNSNHKTPIRVVLEYPASNSVKSVTPFADIQTNEAFLWIITVPPGESSYSIIVEKNPSV